MHSQNECGKYEYYHYKLRLAEVLSSTGDRDCRYNDEAVDSTDHRTHILWSCPAATETNKTNNSRCETVK